MLEDEGALTVLFDLSAVLMADPVKLVQALDELEKDGLELACYTDVGVVEAGAALDKRGLTQWFDRITQKNIDPLCFVSTPEEVDYFKIVERIGVRRPHDRLWLLRGEAPPVEPEAQPDEDVQRFRDELAKRLDR